MNPERIELENKESAQYLFSLKMDEDRARRHRFENIDILIGCH